MFEYALSLWNLRWIVVVIVIVYCIWRNYETKKAERAHEATQEPSLMNDDANWTTLDQLAMDIARLETLTSWHANQRPIFRDAPVRDINVEGGWDVFSDDWGPDISKHYERIFREIRALSPAKRAQRRKVSEKESISARAACTKNSIELPDGTQAKLPSWMLLRLVPRRPPILVKNRRHLSTSTPCVQHTTDPPKARASIESPTGLVFGKNAPPCRGRK
jgi:hypothetical protein